MRAARFSAEKARFRAATGFAEWRDRAQCQSRRVGAAALHQGWGRGRGVPLPPQQEEAESFESPADRIGRGRGVPHAPQQEAGSGGFGRGRGTPFVPPLGVGRGIGAPPPPRSDGLGRGIPLGGNGGVAEGGIEKAVDGSAPSDDGVSAKGPSEGTRQDQDVDPLSCSNEPKKLSAVEKLLAGFGKAEPKPSLEVVPGPKVFAGPKLPAEPEVPPPPPSPPAPTEKPKLPFRMPFARPSPFPNPSPSSLPSAEQRHVSPPKPVFQTKLPSLGALGRGRGQMGAVTQPPIGTEAEDRPHLPGRMAPGVVVQPQPGPEAEVTHPLPGSDLPRQEPSPPRGLDGPQESFKQEALPPRRLDWTSETAKREQPSRPPSPRLSKEEARLRAISILEKGIEKNVAAEGERRSKAGMDRFADAAEYLTDRFKRAPGQGQAQSQRSPTERERPASVSRRTERPRRQRSVREEDVAEPAVEVQLTPEQEAKLVRIQEEDTFKERLHNWFLVHFEPEYAMEEFGRNPDIDEPPVLTLEEYLHSLKPMYLQEGAELSEEQKFQEAVQTTLANASNLEKLVESYAGRGRMTARQQIEKLQTISQGLPPTVPPEVAAFTQRAQLTLQNNPRLRFHQKEQLMKKIVSGFASG